MSGTAVRIAVRVDWIAVRVECSAIWTCAGNRIRHLVNWEHVDHFRDITKKVCVYKKNYYFLDNMFGGVFFVFYYKVEYKKLNDQIFFFIFLLVITIGYEMI